MYLSIGIGPDLILDKRETINAGEKSIQSYQNNADSIASTMDSQIKRGSQKKAKLECVWKSPEIKVDNKGNFTVSHMCEDIHFSWIKITERSTTAHSSSFGTKTLSL